MNEQKIQLLMEIECLEQILKVFQEFFSINQDIQSESAIKVLDMLVNKVKEDIWELVGKDCI